MIQVQRAKDIADIQGDQCKKMRAATGDVIGSINTGWWQTWRAGCCTGGIWQRRRCRRVGLAPWMR